VPPAHPDAVRTTNLRHWRSHPRTIARRNCTSRNEGSQDAAKRTHNHRHLLQAPPCAIHAGWVDSKLVLLPVGYTVGKDTPQTTSGAQAPGAMRGTGADVDNISENESTVWSIDHFQTGTIDTWQAAGLPLDVGAKNCVCLPLRGERGMAIVAATASARSIEVR